MRPRPISNRQRSIRGYVPRRKDPKIIVIEGGLPKSTEHTFASPSKPLLLTNDMVYIEFNLDELTAINSCVFNNYWIKYGMRHRLSIKFKTNIVLKAIEFCTKHADIRNSSHEKLAHDNLKDFHSQFVKENHTILIDLLSLACTMQIRSLLDVTSETIVDMIDGKTAEEIHEMFTLKEDFTFKEMEEVLQYDEWCFKGIMELRLLKDTAENSFNLKCVREKIALDDKSKVLAAEYSSLTYEEKKTWVIAAANIRYMKRLLIAAERRERSRISERCSYLTDEEKRMMREDPICEEVAHGSDNEEAETFELNDLFLSD